MAQDLKSENLTICLPYKGCNKNCFYCISRMTPMVESNKALMMSNLNKVAKLTETAEITSVLFTSKGETLQHNTDLEIIKDLSKPFKDNILEIQTNGIYLADSAGADLIHLYNLGFNVIAISIDDGDNLLSDNYINLFKKISDFGMIVRLTVNANENLRSFFDFNHLIDYCSNNYIRQLMIRKLDIPAFYVPENVDGTDLISKIKKQEKYYNDLIRGFQDYRQNNIVPLLRRLNHGVNIYDVNGISFAYSDDCIQETNNGNNVRSLIFNQDGHIYTSWSSKASILF